MGTIAVMAACAAGTMLALKPSSDSEVIPDNTIEHYSVVHEDDCTWNKYEGWAVPDIGYDNFEGDEATCLADCAYDPKCVMINYYPSDKDCYLFDTTEDDFEY